MVLPVLALKAGMQKPNSCSMGAGRMGLNVLRYSAEDAAFCGARQACQELLSVDVGVLAPAAALLSHNKTAEQLVSGARGAAGQTKMQLQSNACTLRIIRLAILVARALHDQGSPVGRQLLTWPCQGAPALYVSP